MNRDHFLYLLIGLLGGFLAGYLAHETMDGVQPARVAAGAVAAPGPGTAMPSPAAPPPAPPMEEINRLRAVLEKNPEDKDAILRLANLNFDIERWDRAAELYESYLKLQPDDPDVLTDLGITFRARGDFQRALGLFRRAQEVAPAHWQSRFNEAIVLGFDLRDLAAAEQVLAALQQLAPGNPDVERLATELRKRRDAAG